MCSSRDYRRVQGYTRFQSLQLINNPPLIVDIASYLATFVIDVKTLW